MKHAGSRLKAQLKQFTSVQKTLFLYRRARAVMRHLASPGGLDATWEANFAKAGEHIFCHWSESNNFGDAISPALVGILSRRTPVPFHKVANIFGAPVFSAVGSVLQFPASRRLEVWGSGFIYGHGTFLYPPRKIHAVRGPLTRELCIRQGLECPPVYGDPAVLVFDAFRELPRSADYKVGLVPHYVDKASRAVQEFARDPRVLLIDVERDFREVVRDFMVCEFIVSSSLHGLILADALGLPSRWLGVSREVIKDKFKFQDYFASVGRDEPDYLGADDLTLRKVFMQAKLRSTPFDREVLLEACPFRHPGIAGLGDLNRLLLPQQTAQNLGSDQNRTSASSFGFSVAKAVSDSRDSTLTNIVDHQRSA